MIRKSRTRVGVPLVQSVGAQAVEEAREDARVERGRLVGERCARTAASVLNHWSSVLVAGGGILCEGVDVAVIEDVAPGQQRAGLELVGGRDLPAAENVIQDAALQEGAALAERQLVDAGRGEAMRAGGVAGLPDRRRRVSNSFSRIVRFSWSIRV